MKKILNLFKNACAITVFVQLLFFTFVSIDPIVAQTMTYPAFLIILMMGCIISLSHLILEIKPLSVFVRRAIHFFTLLAAIFLLLGLTGFLVGRNTGFYFIVTFVYSLIYAASLLIGYLIGTAREMYSKKKKQPEAKTITASRGISTKSAQKNTSAAQSAQNKNVNPTAKASAHKEKSEETPYSPLFK